MIDRHRFAFAGDGLEVDRPGLALPQADHAASVSLSDIARAGTLHVAQYRQSRLQVGQFLQLASNALRLRTNGRRPTPVRFIRLRATARILRCR